MRTSSAFVERECTTCFRPFRLSARHARRGVTVCRDCRYMPLAPTVKPVHLSYWLRNFSDVEIAEIATEMMGRPVTADAISRSRQIIVASGALIEE